VEGSANAILVAINKYSKYAHFLALRHPFAAATVARLFMDQIYQLHSLPFAIISDYDRVFTSKVWQLLFQMVGMELRMSSSYHPQTDGQMECVNQCLETFLYYFVHACPSRWLQWLPLAEFCYNTSIHSALGRSPFEVFYGFPPRHIGYNIDTATPVPELHSWLEERTLMHSLIRMHLECA
jgi:transposase InsO family protein